MTGEEEPSTDRSSFLRFGRKMSRNEKRVSTEFENVSKKVKH